MSRLHAVLAFVALGLLPPTPAFAAVDPAAAQTVFEEAAQLCGRLYLYPAALRRDRLICRICLWRMT